MQVTCIGAQAAPGGRPAGERAVGSCVSLRCWVPHTSAPCPEFLPLSRCNGNMGEEESWQGVFIDGSAVHQLCPVLKLTLEASGKVFWGHAHHLWLSCCHQWFPHLVGGDDCLVLSSLGGITDLFRLALSRSASLLVGSKPLPSGSPALCRHILLGESVSSPWSSGTVRCWSLVSCFLRTQVSLKPHLLGLR